MKILGKSGKKVVKWGSGLVIFISREAKSLKWDTNTLVRVLLIEHEGRKKLLIEEIGRI